MVEGGKFTVNIENGQPKVYYPPDAKQDEAGIYKDLHLHVFVYTFTIRRD